jgi:Na+-translocating ferredoxin:NAD+ oxidoreductase RnfA subunit
MMHYLDTLFMYAFSCSTLLVYGIGLERAYFESHPGASWLKEVPVFLLDALLSVSVLWFVVTKLLIPYDLQILAPMAAILVCGIISLIVALIMPQESKMPTGGHIFFFGTVFLAIEQASSFIDALVIVCASMLSFSLFTIVLYAIRDRMASGHPHADWKGAPLVLISMGLLAMVLYSADISWWLTEVLK